MLTSDLWIKESTYTYILLQVNPKAAESLANPEEYPNLFEDWQVLIFLQHLLKKNIAVTSHSNPLHTSNIPQPFLTARMENTVSYNGSREVSNKNQHLSSLILES